MAAAKTTIDPEFQELIPPLSPNELKALEENILSNGCRDSLVVWEGLLLDGHNRKAICDKHGIDFPTVEAKGVRNRDDAKAWIIKNQLGRRNVSESIRAVLATALETIYAKQARERELAGKGADGSGGRGNRTNPVANLPQGFEGRAREQAAEAMGVSPRLVQAAKKVVTDGTDKLRQAVMNGRAAVSAAAEVATLPKKKQDEIIAAGPKAIANAASEIRRQRRTSSQTPCGGKSKLTAKQIGRLAELVTELKRLTDVPKMQYSPIDVRACVAEIMKIVL